MAVVLMARPYIAMVAGEGYLGVPALCFFSALTGIGSCCSFGGALKMGECPSSPAKNRQANGQTIAALNWPAHRGTAKAIPLAAFGLSAFVFSALSSWLFPGNTESFLLLLAVATSGVIVVAFFFCRVVPVPGAYGAVPTADPDASRLLHRPKSGESRHRHSRRLHRHDDDQLGTNTTAAAAAAAAVDAAAATTVRSVGGKKQSPSSSPSPSPPPPTSPMATVATTPNLEPSPDENSSLISQSSEEEEDEDEDVGGEIGRAHV